jgi:hypothetical protein
MEVGGVAAVSDYPFAFNTPKAPIGEHVRLQSAARMDLVDDWPHTVLFGDPTFYQCDSERISYTVKESGGETVISITGSADSIATAVLLRLSGPTDIEWAESNIDGKRRRYGRGLLYWGGCFSTAPAWGGQAVLVDWPGIDGYLTLSSRPSLAVLMMKVFNNALVGVQAIFADLPGAIGGVDWSITFFSMLILGVAVIRRRRQKDISIWMGLLTVAGVAILLELAVVMTDVDGPWSFVIAAACGAGAVTLLACPGYGTFRRVLLATAWYLVPLFLALIMLSGFVSSQRIYVALVTGVLLVGAIYVFALSISRLVCRSVADLVTAWRRK